MRSRGRRIASNSKSLQTVWKIPRQPRLQSEGPVPKVRAGAIAELAKFSPSVHEAWLLSPVPPKLEGPSSTQEAEARSDIQGHPRLHHNFEANLDYMRLSHKQNQMHIMETPLLTPESYT